MSLRLLPSLDSLDSNQKLELVGFQRDPALLNRVKFLSDQDRALVELSLRHGLSRRKMGLALGLTAGTVTRRLRRLMNRLRDPLIVAITDPLCTLPAEHRQITIEYFLHDFPIPKIAQIHQMTRFEVREMLEYVRGWHRGVSKESRTRNHEVMS